MKRAFIITDCISGQVVARIETNNGKNALRKFRNGLMATGFYEIHKRCNRWILSSTYGAYFIASPEQK